MARSVYVASVTGETGKSTVALGALEALTRRLGRVGVFRPVVRAGTQPDYVLELLLEHDGVDLPYDVCAGVTYEDVHADPDAAMSTILSRYRAVAAQCEAVVIVGSDYTDVDSPTEFSFNARVAANLGAPVVLVLNGHDRTPADLRAVAELATAELAANYGTLAALVANRVPPAELDGARAAMSALGPAYALPEEPLLSAPTMSDLVAAGGGELVRGDPTRLGREVGGLVVAGMTLPNVLDRLFDDAVVITPADRSDVLLGVLAAHASKTFPTLAGVVLNGGFELPPQVVRLMDGLDVGLPIATAPGDTLATATALTAVRGRLTYDATRKVQTALALFDRHVDAGDLLDRLDVTRSGVVTPLMFEHDLIDRARGRQISGRAGETWPGRRRHIVLPEGTEERVLRAADTVLRRGIADLTLLGPPADVAAAADRIGVDIGAAQIVDPRESELRGRFAHEYARLRTHRGVTQEAAWDTVADVSYFGTMMVHLGLADGMVSGAAHTTAHTIRPAFEVIKTPAGAEAGREVSGSGQSPQGQGTAVSIVSSVFFMCLRDRVLVYGDCAVNPDPTAEQLADIAISSAETAARFGIDPRVAMLSYSTGESGTGSDVDKVRAATSLVRARRPELEVEGPIQYDAAVDASVARAKLPGSEVAGRATVFIFPDLNTGNNTYKAVQRSAGAVAIGPVLQGLRKPVNDLSRGALVRDIVNTIAITAIQAQSAEPPAGDEPAEAT